MVSLYIVTMGGQSMEVIGDTNEGTVKNLLGDKRVEILDMVKHLGEGEAFLLDLAYLSMLRDLADMALDTGDRQWFMHLTCLLAMAIDSVGSDGNGYGNK